MKTKRKASEQRDVERQWGDTPVRDAKKGLRLVTYQTDIDHATRKHPGCCIFAQACKRMVGASKVLFLKRHAYVEMLDENGKPVVERFTLGKQVHDEIVAFDRGKKISPKGGYVLAAPCKSRRLAAMARAGRAYRLRKKKGQVEALTSRGPKKTPREIVLVDLSVRSGRGVVQSMTRAKKRK